MKITAQRVIVVLCMLALFTAGFLAHKAWINEELRASIRNSTVQAAEDYKARKRAERVQAELARIKAECDKSIANYNKLTPAQQKTAQVPACKDLAIVE